LQIAAIVVSVAMASIFDLPNYQPYQPPWSARTARYARYRAYYTGTAYDRLGRFAAAQKLYSGTRTLFSPLRRCVRVDVAKAPAGWALPADASRMTGEAVAELRRQSGAEAAYQRFLLYSAVVGEAALLLSGSPDAPEVNAYRADEVIVGKNEALVIKTTPDQASGVGRQVEYAQVITPEYVQEYRDGQPAGEPLPNAWGVVPLVLSSYIEGEDGFGEPAFGGVLELLDRVNELASLTLDVVTRNAEPLLVATGVQKIEMSPGQDAITERNEQAKFYTVNPQLAIAETLEVIADVRQEYKNLLPQLRLDALSGASDLAYDTVVTLLSELGDHILAVRGSVDIAVETVERWMLDATGGTPADYRLDRERRWLPMSETQQLDLELKRLELEERRQALRQAQEAPLAAGPSRRPALEALARSNGHG
jgi:hypothetical protein